MMPAKRKSAYFAATEAAQKRQEDETVTRYHSDTVEPLESETVTPLYRETGERLFSNTVSQHYGETGEQFEKTTFYLTPEQAEKLDDLAHDYKKRAGLRINRNDIVRHLIDQATLDSLEGIKRHVRKPGQK